MILCHTPSNYFKFISSLLVDLWLISFWILCLSCIVSRRVDVNAGQEETAVAVILEGLVREIHSNVGVRMHRLGVCEWEVKLWMASSGQANGAWRVVVTNVTGHTCTVHVSVFTIFGCLEIGPPPGDTFKLQVF